MEPWAGGGDQRRRVGCLSDSCDEQPFVYGDTPDEASAAWNGLRIAADIINPYGSGPAPIGPREDAA